MAKIKNEEENVLILGDEQKEIQVKVKQRESLHLPIAMVVIGIILIIFGYFFKDIAGFFINTFKQGKPEKTIEEIQEEKKELLKCSKKESDDSLEITTIDTYSFYFKKKKLKTLEERKIVKSYPDSDIGPDNVKTISNKQKKNVKKFQKLDGISVSQDIGPEKSFIDITVEYNKIDNEKVPDDELIKINYKYDEEYKTIQQIMVRDYHYICK